MEKKVSKITKLFDHKMWMYDFVKVTGALPVIIDLRIKRLYIRGKKPKKYFKGKYIVASNHVSFIDPIIISDAVASRRVGFVATSELFKSKSGRWWFKRFGCIEINKENPSMKTFKEVNERLNRGHIVCVFPEGTVVEGNEMKAFKSGLVLMAVMAKADIMPMYIVKRTSRWHRQIVVMGEKIKLSDYINSEIPNMEEIEKVSEILKEKELELERYYLDYKAKKEGKKHGKDL